MPPPRPLLVAAFVALALLAPSARAQDTTRYSKRKADSIFALRGKENAGGTRTPVLLSFSGGISLGAYQAGVNWVMLETIKASIHRDPRGSLARLYPADVLPTMPVLAMTGASAGNINALLASISYCQPRPDEPATESLFWKMWVESGWDELFPEGRARGPDPGALDRSAAMRRVRASIDSTMQAGEFLRGCTMPIGVSLTRIHAVDVPLDRHLTYRTQRMAALFTIEEAAGRLRSTRQSTGLLDARELGAQLVLPSRDGHLVALDDVFGVVMASSSYPVAFAPVRIAYQAPGCVRTPGCLAADTARFMDGGVFDNNPVSLAVGMGEVVRRGAAGTTPRPAVWFVDPDATREGSRLARRAMVRDSIATANENDDRDGVGALASFLVGFVPSARQYELQAFARGQQALHPSQQTQIRSSVRSHPVIGEHLGEFAAFFGRPFRELDFHVGVSDGMRFVAGEVLCRGRAPWRLDPTLGARVSESYADSILPNAALEGVLRECETREARRLAELAFALDPVGRRIVQRALQRDIPVVQPSSPGPLAAGDSARLTVLAALEDATWSKLDTPVPTRGTCANGRFLMRALCTDRFDHVLTEMRHRDDAMRILRCRSGDRGCRPYPAPVEQTATLIDDPQGTLDKYLTLALIEMRRTERAEASKWLAALKMAEMVYRAADDHPGWTYSGGPSSIPKHDLPWSALGVFPYFAGTTIGVRGYQFGWQPTLRTPLGGLIFQVPFGAIGIPSGADHSAGVSTSAFATPSVGLELRGGYVNQLAIGARVQSTGKLGAGLGAELIAPEASGYVLGRVLRWNVYRIPGRMSESGRSRYIWGLSLADVNGIAYWVARRP